MLRKLTLSQRLLLLQLVSAVFVLALLGGFALTQSRVQDAAGDLGAQVLDREIQSKLEVATHAMAASLAQMRADAPDEATFLEHARATLKDLRYEEDQSGYFYVYRGTVPVVHPTKPAQVGKDLAHKKDARGTFFVRERAEQIAKDGRAMLRYAHSKPGGGEVMKLAYAERIPGTDLLVGTGAYLDNVREDRAHIRAEVADIGRQGMLWTMLPVLLLGALVVVPLSVALARSITRPLRATVAAMEDIGTGDADLTQRLDDEGNDEIAQLATAFNGFVDNLSGMIRSVAESSHALTASASTLTESSAKMATGARSMRTRSESTARAMQEVRGQVQAIASTTDGSSQQVSAVADTTHTLSSSANDVASGSTQVAAEIGTVASAMEELSASFQEVARSCQSSAEIGDQSAKRVQAAVAQLDALQAAALQIDKIVDLINDVADQTNLLALNATIEAAAAGEAGRGFAVVANEVKTLAQETAKATQEITEHVTRMQTTTRASGEMMREVAELTTNLRGLTDTIAAAAEEQTMTMRSLSQSVNQGAEAANSVMRGVSDISSGVVGLAGNSQSLAEGAEAVASSTRSMASRAGDVANDVDALLSETAQAAEEIERVDGIAKSLAANASGLQRLVAGFKA